MEGQWTGLHLEVCPHLTVSEDKHPSGVARIKLSTQASPPPPYLGTQGSSLGPVEHYVTMTPSPAALVSWALRETGLAAASKPQL